MDLNIFDVIKAPCVTTKSYRLNQNARQLVVEVHPKANKPQIKEALKKLFNVDAEAVRTIVVKGKRRRVARRVVEGITRKKAVITLKGDQALDLAGWGRAAQAASGTQSSQDNR